MAHLQAPGKQHGIKNAPAILKKVESAVAKWPHYAEQAGVSRKSTKEMAGKIKRILPRGQSFCAWLTVGKLIAADHNGNEAGDLGNRSGEEVLKSGEPRVEWRAAGLGECNGRNNEDQGQKSDSRAYPMRA